MSRSDDIKLKLSLFNRKTRFMSEFNRGHLIK